MSASIPEEILHAHVVSYLRQVYPSVRFVSGMEGVRLSKFQARNNKALQWGPGAPDLRIFHRGIHGKTSGLFIELKKQSPWRRDGLLKAGQHLIDQSLWHQALRSQGWVGGFAWTFDQARDMIDLHLKGRTIG